MITTTGVDKGLPRSDDPADVSGLVERLGHSAAFAFPVVQEAASLIQSQAAEIARCHARLEIDHYFAPRPDRPTDTADDLIRVEVPMAERQAQIDGIECRDATIKGQDQQIDAMRARIAEFEAGLRPFAQRCDEAVRLDYGDNDVVTVKTKHLRTARSLLNGERKEEPHPNRKTSRSDDWHYDNEGYCDNPGRGY